VTTVSQHRVSFCALEKDDAHPLRFWMMPLQSKTQRESHCS